VGTYRRNLEGRLLYSRDSERYIKEGAGIGVSLSLYRRSIRANWSGASLLGTTTDIKDGNRALLGYAE